MESAWMNGYLDSLRRRNYSAETVRTYEGIIRQFGQFGVDNNIDLLAVDLRMARQFVVHHSEKDTNPVSINNYNTALRLFYNYLLSEGAVSQNPFLSLERLKQGKPLPSFVPLTEMKKLFDIIGETDSFSVRDIAMFEFFYGSGVRTSELCEAELEDLSLSREEFKVVRGKGGKQRVVPLPAGVVLIMEKYLPLRANRWPASRFLFPNAHGGRFNRGNVYKIIQSFLDLTSAKKKGAHTLRHTYATHLIQAGAGIREVQELLGHESPQTTTKYDHNDHERLSKIFRLAHPRG